MEPLRKRARVMTVKKTICFVLCLLLIASLSGIACAASSVPASVMEATGSVVRVLANYPDGYSTGSGFVIKSDRESTLIATNYHVVEDNPHSISVWISEEETISASILAHASQKDMCVLELSYPVSLKALPLAKDDIGQGAAVYAVGFPAAADILSDKEAHTSEDVTITDGIVSAVRQTTVTGYGTPVSILQINAAINSGNSGGPLFNTNGEVVGINTYGITSAQGIFGAIGISELKDFLADNSIKIENTKETANVLYLLIILAVITALAVCVVIAVIRKKAKRASLPILEKSITLREYIANHPDGIAIQNAVAMLLPVALHLRDLHNDGKAHLQISPDTIILGSSGAVLEPSTDSESARYTSGFAAPEIYKGISSGNLSDIYSFTAVLYYTLTGKQPINALSRPENSPMISNTEDSQFDADIIELINRGLAIAPEDRFGSMQELILKISPYHVAPFAKDTSAAIAPAPAAPCAAKKVKPISLMVGVVGSLVVLFCASYIGCYIAARSHAQSGRFESADRLLFVPAITKLHDAPLVDYIDAGLLMDAREYDEAKKKIEGIPDYRNADELAHEIDYRHAAQYADANDFEKAAEIYTSLSSLGYKDSAQKVLETQFRYGTFLLYEEANYPEASKIFMQLKSKKYDGAQEMYKETVYQWAFSLVDDEEYIEAYKKFSSIKGYADTDEAISALTELIYLEAQLLYSEGNYTDARYYFNRIPKYADSRTYLALIAAREYTWFAPAETVDELVEYFYFEDTAEVLLSSNALAEKFLLGTWKGAGYYFTMKDDGHISYNLPWLSYGDYYRIEDGYVLLYPENDENATKKLFHFTAITPDCMEVYCYKNDRTYTLNRQ